MWQSKDGDIEEALAIINAEKYDQGFTVKALAERIARIRAEARAEALKEAKMKALAWWFDPNTPNTPEAMGDAILTGEPKEEHESCLDCGLKCPNDCPMDK